MSVLHHLPQFHPRRRLQLHLQARIDEEGIDARADLHARVAPLQDRGDLLLHLALPAVKLLQQLLGQFAALLAVLAEQPAADGQQHIPVVDVDDVGFFADAEVDRPVLLLDLGIAQQVQQLGRFAAAAVPGEEELGRAVERRQQRVRQLRDRIAGPVDVEGIGLAVLPGLERQVQLEVQPGPVEVGCDDVVEITHR